MNLTLKSATLLLTLTLGTFASAETLTGTVKNGTTGKPGAGDEVVLIKLANGMEEAARTKADSKGNFKFNYDDAGGPHLIRAIHGGVTYHRMAPPGTTSVELEVFDVGKKVRRHLGDRRRHALPGGKWAARSHSPVRRRQ